MFKYIYSIFMLIMLYSCSIEPTNGVDGQDGMDGENGIDGNDGLNTLVLTETEPPGDNCSNGGTKVSFGLDEDEDGFLDDNEVRNSIYLCNGEDGQDGEDGIIISSENSALIGSWVMDSLWLNITEQNEGVYDTSFNEYYGSPFDLGGLINWAPDCWGATSFPGVDVAIELITITENLFIRCKSLECDENEGISVYWWSSNNDGIILHQGTDSVNDACFLFYNLDESENKIFFREQLNGSIGSRVTFTRYE